MLLDLQDLRFAYPERFQLEIDRLQVEEGEKIAIVGPNGSGKTTLLRILAFLERPISYRRFRYRGRDVACTRIARNGLGLLRQQPWIFRGTVAQNLSYGLRARGLPVSEIERSVERVGDRLGLDPLLGAPARRLSGGEQKRVALGRVLIMEPDLLLLDEPMAHLDRSSRAIIEDAIARCEATILFTAHELPLAVKLSNRLLHLSDGRVLHEPAGALDRRRAGAGRRP